MRLSILCLTTILNVKRAWSSYTTNLDVIYLLGNSCLGGKARWRLSGATCDGVVRFSVLMTGWESAVMWHWRVQRTYGCAFPPNPEQNRNQAPTQSTALSAPGRRISCVSMCRRTRCAIGSRQLSQGRSVLSRLRF